MGNDLLIFHIVGVVVLLLLFLLNSYFKIRKLKRKVAALENNVGNDDVVNSRKSRINQDIAKLQRKKQETK